MRALTHTRGAGAVGGWRQAARGILASVLPPRLFLVRGPARSGAVCLTFDDGPHPEHTPRVLDVLRDHGVPATFFVIGRNVGRYPALVRRVVAEGHDLGHHSYTHGEPGRTSAAELLREVCQSRELLRTVLGRDSCLFRPPKGGVTVAKLWRLWRARQTVVLWSADPKDYARASAAEVGAWFEANPPHGGDVVLLHDNQPHAAAALPELIASARARGLTFTRISEWTQ